MDRTEKWRREVLAGLQAYDERLAERLSGYRRQRAWQAMLLLRKAYTLLLRRGWSGRIDLLRWALLDLPRGRTLLDEHELEFPDVWQFLPEELQVPWDAVPVRPAGPIDQRALPVRAYDVVVLPVFEFEFRYQRPQQLAVGLARAGHRVYWVSASRTLPVGGAPYRLLRLRQNVWEVQLPGPPLDLYGGRLTAERARELRAALDALARDEGLAETCTLVQFPFWRRLARELRTNWGARVVYDCMDDWAHWPTEPLISPAVLADERELVRECDVLTVTAHALARRHADGPAQPLLLPNGADVELFAAAEPHPELANLPGPCVGYYGAIADWFDAPLVEALARSRPHYTFVLIGQVHGRDLGELPRLANVRLLGERPYREIPAFLRCFDVCLIPFAVNTLTQAVDPVKMYEYLSQGKPVVACRMAELEPHAHVLSLATGPAEFGAAIDRALATDDEACRAARRAFASANTWGHRVGALDKAARDSFPLISLVVLCHDSRPYLRPFWESVRRNTSYPHFEVIFVDNASRDGSLDLLDEIAAEDGRVRVVALDENLGFAGGNNEGVLRARGEHLVLLNPDTMVTWGWLGRLLRRVEADGTVGMVAPVTNYSGNETRIRTRYRTLGDMEEFAAALARKEAGRSREVGMAPLLCVLLPRRVWERVGELDTRFAVGMFEDDDYSLRVRQAGYRVVTAEDCLVHHFGHGSFSQLPAEESLRIFVENREAFEAKWGRPWAPHQMRLGVPPLGPADRLEVGSFLWGTLPAGPSAAIPPMLRRLQPARTRVGAVFQRQPDGHAALIVHCAGATPDTVVRFGGVSLVTAYGGPNLMTAIVPPEWYARPGRHAVALESPSGHSAPQVFEVVG